ncbi:transposase [Pseudodesulfovibrio nedwellii]|uniref:Transposase n=1 Tax=Pseudodesulfovibrio nedwellii TaxID=2973072 RepID=A0ABM8B0J4_9BACT|nr:recombinase family protein [Pseudodesulfovibrio nedwellii]BDQ37091.1 transposase [Pseudodesulfovibrio nedwellii]
MENKKDDLDLIADLDLGLDFKKHISDKPRLIDYTRYGPTEKNKANFEDDMGYLISDVSFLDQAGSKTTEYRPQLEKCINQLRQGDRLNIPSIDRLARNTKELVELIKRIADKGVSIEFEREGIKLGPELPDFEEKLNLIEGIYKAEQAVALERRKEGLIKAKKKGVRLGRPTKVSDEKRSQIRRRLADGEKAPSLAKEYGISESLVYTIGREGGR